MLLFKLVLALFILCIGNAVSAESAWVLWSKETSHNALLGREEDDWKIETSHKTMGECQESLKDFIWEKE